MGALRPWGEWSSWPPMNQKPHTAEKRWGTPTKLAFDMQEERIKLLPLILLFYFFMITKTLISWDVLGPQICLKLAFSVWKAWLGKRGAAPPPQRVDAVGHSKSRTLPKNLTSSWNNKAISCTLTQGCRANSRGHRGRDMNKRKERGREKIFWKCRWRTLSLCLRHTLSSWPGGRVCFCISDC